MKNILLFTILASVCLGEEMDYFQQHVAYDIEVTLDDKPLNVDNGSMWTEYGFS